MVTTPEMLIDAGLNYIYVEVATGRGNHGNFLMSFADAWARADFENKNVLRDAAMALATKYNLYRYLPAKVEEML